MSIGTRILEAIANAETEIDFHSRTAATMRINHDWDCMCERFQGWNAEDAAHELVAEARALPGLMADAAKVHEPKRLGIRAERYRVLIAKCNKIRASRATMS